jgi:hypothetical protein
MTDYRRNFLAGGSFFFTVNLAARRPTGPGKYWLLPWFCPEAGPQMTGQR